jgi:hypothetical protein
MKSLAYLVVFCLLLLGLNLPVLAEDGISGGNKGSDGANSITVALPYLMGGFAYADYEHSLSEHSAVNITAMHLYDGFYKFFFKVLFLGTETDFTAVDLSYKRYLGSAQNGLYCGANLMFAQVELSNESSSAETNFTLYGGSLGLRNITHWGLTYDIGAILYYNHDNQEAAPLLRLNLGYGW